MEPVFEFRDHAEVSTTATNGPEQIRIGVGTGPNLLAIHEYDLRRNDVVASRSMHRHQLPSHRQA
jgi:hypothetical protein